MVRRLREWVATFQGPVALGIATIGIVAFLAIYIVFSLSAKRTIEDFPVVLTTQRVLEESTPLFAIPVDEMNIHYGPKYNRRVPYYIQGFATGDDGTFWIIDVSSRLLHYSSEGALLGQTTLPKLLVGSTLLDLKARGSDVWILAFVEPLRGSMPATLFKLSHSGHELARYVIPDDSTVRFGTMIFGEGGEILLYSPSVTPQLWQFVDSGGMLDLKPMEGYTNQGKLYSARLDDSGNRYNRSATIKAGDAKFSISLTQPNMILSGVCVCHVNLDGSFYLFTEEWDRHSIGFMPPEYRSILHYSADGMPLARVPEVLTGDEQPGSWLWASWSWHERLALRADGSIYLLKAMPEERVNTTHFEVHRLEFGQAR